MSRLPLLSVVMLLIGAVSPAHAVVFAGNPKVGFHVDRSAGDYVDGAVYLTGVRVHYCGGGYDQYAVGQTVDPVAGHEVTVAGGDLCGVTWYWGSAMEIEGASFSLEANDASTSATIQSNGDVDP